LPRKSEAFSAFPHVCHDLIGRDVERHTRYIQGRFGGCRRFDHEDAAILAADANLCAFGGLFEQRREPLNKCRLSWVHLGDPRFEALHHIVAPREKQKAY